MATICRDVAKEGRGRALVLAHVKELLEQTHEKLAQVAPDLNVGLYSAGLRRRELDRRVTVAGIQSIYKRAAELGTVDIILVDEAHMVPADEEGRYRQFLAEAAQVNPSVRVVGLTATPYRLKSGPICGPNYILNHICYEVNIRTLIEQGFLSPLRTKAGMQKVDTDDLHVRGGEFVANEVESLMDEEALVRGACAEIVDYTRDRRATLIFASGVNHGRHVVEEFRSVHGKECGFICADTPARDRAAILARYRRGELRYLCNVNVLTTGFDAPHIDCVALLRPTASTGLYYQMVGRGFRTHPGKAECLVLDFGGNVIRHGPVDALTVEVLDRGDGTAPAKECPHCRALVPAGCRTCPDCGRPFPPPEQRAHEVEAATVSILSGQAISEEFTLQRTTYHLHFKGGDQRTVPTMRVEYQATSGRIVREWVCFEHTGYALSRARQWWGDRSKAPFPRSVRGAVELANAGALAEPRSISVKRRPNEGFDRITVIESAPSPPWPPASIHGIRDAESGVRATSQRDEGIPI